MTVWIKLSPTCPFRGELQKQLFHVTNVMLLGLSMLPFGSAFAIDIPFPHEKKVHLCFQEIKCIRFSFRGLKCLLLCLRFVM
ncbi:hypothetical protein Leryth_019143 [Lithospermum erythrorhizon]|nr:hypothetical protein Leryth_019143 [Lithospermum erythrorhizon]